MKREIVELAEWLRDEDEEHIFDHLPMTITDSPAEQKEVSLLAALSDLMASDPS